MKIEKIITEVADEIVSKKETLIEQVDVGLFSGITGIALFLFHLSEHTKDEKYNNTAKYFIEKAFERINSGYSYATLCNGIAGVAWALNYLVRKSFINEENLEVLDHLDDYLYRSMKSYAQKNNFDFLHGATGVALYFTSRTVLNKNAANYLKEFVELLLNDSEYDMSDNTYKRKSPILDAEGKQQPVYNLGMAHGMSSIISVLAKIYILDKENSDAKKMIEGYCNYLIKQENKNKYNNGSMFANTIPIEYTGKLEDLRNSKLGWCYGDMGNGFALYHAFKALGNKGHYNKFLEIFLNSAERQVSETRTVRDACMCHGSSGIADIFRTVNEHTQIDEFNKACKFWVDYTLNFYKMNGLTGFSKNTVNGPEYNYNFLEGTSGIALTLLFYINGKRSEWNEFLLLR